MEDVSSAILDVGQEDLEASLDDASKFVENHNVREANTTGGKEVSTFATSRPTASCSESYSMRIASMMASRSEFETELEFQTAHSKVHWSELSHREGPSSIEGPSLDHRQYFEKLQKDVHWGPFCSRVTNVVLGKKLGEGAQADIYEAQVTFARSDMCWNQEGCKFVVKLMKGDYALEDLQRQWTHNVGSLSPWELLLNLHGALVKEPATERNKFGFVMPRYWGDLRSVIDLYMEHKNAKGPPFSLQRVKFVINNIVQDMLLLHKKGIIHRDLKASNVLVSCFPGYDYVSPIDERWNFIYVADWECSMGVVGTGWWRAPEILLQLKNKTPSSKLEFNEKVDVYSFAMTCYEIATGLLPFEGHPYCIELRDAIINGTRPELPHDLDLGIKAVIISSWDSNPLVRPSFGKLYEMCKAFF